MGGRQEAVKQNQPWLLPLDQQDGPSSKYGQFGPKRFL